MNATRTNREPASALRIVEPDGAPSWNEYVIAHAKGTIFHTAEMIDVYAATPNHQPFAVAAVDEAGEIIAMLVAVRIETVPGVASGMASRSVWHAEPLCNDDARSIDALVSLIECHDRYMKTQTLFSEVRPIGPPGAERIALKRCGYEFMDYLNYVVDLAPGEETLKKNLRRGCRQNISRSPRKHVCVEEATSAEGVEQMYALVQCSYERAKVPLVDVAQFHAALDKLPQGTAQVRIARHNDDPVAGGIALVFKGIMYAWYGGTSRKPGITPFDCLTWDEIRWGSEQGLRLYDFGGAGWPGEEYGPRAFKAKFGGELVHHGRYRKIYSSWKLAMAKVSYELLRGVVSPTSPK